MPEDSFESVSQGLDDLWRKAEASSTEVPALSVGDPAQAFSTQAAWEALSLIRRKSRDESNELSQLLGSKHQDLEKSRQRELFFQSQIQELRHALASQEAMMLQEGLETEGKIEAALKALDQERKSATIEKEKLKALMSQMRDRLAEQTKIFEQENATWQKKEEEYLQSLRELQAVTGRLQKESAASTEEAQRYSQSIKEAKNALEKTLAELLEERRRSSEAEKERAQALKKVSDLEKHLEGLSKIWDEERAQWRELWERERSAWQNQRAELSSWEENLRKEREAWHADLSVKEADHLRFTEAMNQSVRESAEATARLASFMDGVSQKATGFSGSVRRTLGRKGFWLSVLFLGLVSGAGYQTWNYFNHFHFRALSIQQTELSNPTGLAFDGNTLWSSQWDGNVKAFDPQSPERILRSALVLAKKPYHPSAISFANGSLWSLDAAQARLIEESPKDPAVVVAAYPTPGPAPTALAFDGKSLWSYDAVNAALYRHGDDPSQTQAFPLGTDLAATAMAWINGRLWMFDSKGRRLLVFQFLKEKLSLQAAYPTHETILGIVPSGHRKVFILAGPNADHSTPTLIQYSY